MFSVAQTRGRDGQILDNGLGRGTTSRLVGEDEHIGASVFTPQQVGFPRVSYDMPLLVKYKHHIALHLWSSKERGQKKEMMVVEHGLKLT
ncbi:hypothetical protein RYX36_036419 [Vicia faba]